MKRGPVLSMRKRTIHSDHSNQPASSTKAHRGRFGRVAAYALLAVIGLVLGFAIYVMILLGQPLRTSIAIVDNYDPISLDDIQLSDDDLTSVPWSEGGRTRVYVNEDFPIRKVEQKDSQIENILVFGVDSRGVSNVVCRADTLIIVTIDRRHGQIKLTSLMRDMRVDIEGRTSPDRINTAYAYGGVGLLINTINETFDLDIQRFAMFDFWSAATLIDSLGGVDLTITEEELPYLNHNLKETNDLSGQSVPDVVEAGQQHLNGAQAIAWARIRKLDSDYIRTSRQRTVMMSLISKYASSSVASLIGLANDGLSAFETNMTNADMIRVAVNSLPVSSDIVQYRVPADGLYTVMTNPWMMIVDFDAQRAELKDFIYGD